MLDLRKNAKKANTTANFIAALLGPRRYALLMICSSNLIVIGCLLGVGLGNVNFMACSIFLVSCDLNTVVLFP